MRAVELETHSHQERQRRVDEHVKQRREREAEHCRLVAEGHRLNRAQRRASPLYFRARRRQRERARIEAIWQALGLEP